MGAITAELVDTGEKRDTRGRRVTPMERRLHLVHLSHAPSNSDELELLRQENAALLAQIAWLKQKMFGGGKSEKLDQAQLRLQLEELEKIAAQTAGRVETITYERTQAAKEPRTVPAETFAHLHVAETIELVPEAVKQDPELYEKIGEERNQHILLFA